MKKIIIGIVVGLALGYAGNLIASCLRCYSCQGTGMKWEACYACGGQGGKYSACYYCNGAGQKCY